jgi:hypothetical protein
LYETLKSKSKEINILWSEKEKVEKRCQLIKTEKRHVVGKLFDANKKAEKLMLDKQRCMIHMVWESHKGFSTKFLEHFYFLLINSVFSLPYFELDFLKYASLDNCLILIYILSRYLAVHMCICFSFCKNSAQEQLPLKNTHILGKSAVDY